MYPYYWGSSPLGNLTGMPPAILPTVDDDLRDLPEDVRAEIESRRDRIHSARDLRLLANELLLRR